MIASPLATATLFHIGPIGISAPVVATWVIMALLACGSAWITRRLSLTPSKMQTVLELVVSTIDDQIRDTMQAEPERYRALVGTLFLFILVSNWSSLLPGVFAEPTWIMIPLNVVEQITRTFSLVVRLFGNVMSGVFVVGIVLSLAGLLVPIPLMALDLLTGAVQAYIFSVLAMVFIGAALAENSANTSSKQAGQQ